MEINIIEPCSGELAQLEAGHVAVDDAEGNVNKW